MASGTYDTINRIFDTFAVTSRSRYVYVYDMEKNISRWSLNAVDYFGLTGEYIYNASSVWANRIHPEDRDKYNEYIRNIVPISKMLRDGVYTKEIIEKAEEILLK